MAAPRPPEAGRPRAAEKTRLNRITQDHSSLEEADLSCINVFYLSHFPTVFHAGCVMIVNTFYKEALQLIYHQSIETKVLLYWRGGKPDVKSMYQRYSQSNQNIRLFCACLACNRKNFVSGFTFPFHSIVLKDTGNCNENNLKFCSIIWYRNQSIDFQPRFSSPLSS